MANFTTAYASVGLTTMRNKYHLNLNEGNRPQCGQGVIKDYIVIEPIRSVVHKQEAIDRAVRTALKADPNTDFCGRCFKAGA